MEHSARPADRMQEIVGCARIVAEVGSDVDLHHMQGSGPDGTLLPGVALGCAERVDQ